MNLRLALSNIYLGAQFNQFIRDAVQECGLQQNVEWIKTCRNRKIAQVASQVFAYLLTLSLVVLVGKALVPRRWLALNAHVQKFLTDPASNVCLIIGSILSFIGCICLKSVADTIYQDFIKLTLVQLRNVPEAWNLIQRYGKQVTDLDLAKEEDKNLNLTDAKLEHIAQCLPDLTNVRMHADQLSINGFMQMQRDCPKLKRLHLEGTCLLNGSEYGIFEQFQKLNTLSIQDAVHLNTQGFQSICCLFSHSLRSLHLTANLLDRGAIHTLCQIPNLRFNELKLYSSALEPLDFLLLIQATKKIEGSISLKCERNQSHQIPTLIRALNSYHGSSDGEWTWSYRGSITTLYFEEYSSDSDSDDD